MLAKLDLFGQDIRIIQNATGCIPPEYGWKIYSVNPQ